MDRILIDASSRFVLPQVDRQWELCDETGQTVGYYFPVAPPGSAPASWEWDDISQEELERRDQEPGGRTTAEILRDLESR